MASTTDKKCLECKSQAVLGFDRCIFHLSKVYNEVNSE